jgi:hypothetical protein
VPIVALATALLGVLAAAVAGSTRVPRSFADRRWSRGATMSLPLTD